MSYHPCPKCKEPSERFPRNHETQDAVRMKCLGCSHLWYRDPRVRLEPLEGHVETVDDLLHTFKFLGKDIVIIHVKPDIPDLPNDSKWHDLVTFLHVKGPRGTFWAYCLDTEIEAAKKEVHKIIEKLGGKVTGEGVLH